MKKTWNVALLISTILILTSESVAFAEELPPRVVVIILDGVRRMEAFYPKSGKDPFPLLRSRIQKGDLLSFGDPKKNERMTVSNSYAVSLPGYQSILSGKDSGSKCTGNSEKDCPLQPNETFLDLFSKQPTTDEKDLVSLASWVGLDRAVSVNRSPVFFHNASFTPTTSPDAVQNQKERSYFTDLDSRISTDRPSWGNSRKDKYTREYFEKIDSLDPRLSIIQLVDSDEWGHKNDFESYYQAIREDEAWIDSLMQRADAREALGITGPTHFIITTDHGRGEGKSILDVFRSHGKWQPSSYLIWSYLRISPLSRTTLKKSTRKNYSHVNIRPTVEFLLGLNPSCGSNCLVE